MATTKKGNVCFPVPVCFSKIKVLCLACDEVLEVMKKINLEKLEELKVTNI